MGRHDWGPMERGHEARERLRQQRVYRRWLLFDALARGMMDMVARHEGAIRRAARSLVALDAAPVARSGSSGPCFRTSAGCALPHHEHRRAREAMK